MFLPGSQYQIYPGAFYHDPLRKEKSGIGYTAQSSFAKTFPVFITEIL
jgi:hypothetical protein